MAKRLKRAFTITELVIVIAVVAILAAVLIPTFSNIINKANESADTQLVKNLNTILSSEQTVSQEAAPTMSKALEQALEGGYTVDKLTPTSDGDILWEQDSNRFVLVSGGKILFKDSTTAADIATEPYKFWKITNKEADLAEEEYSHYLGAGFAGTDLTVKAGVDTGENTTVTSITYNSPVMSAPAAGAERAVLINTNKNRCDVTVKAPYDTVKRYGDAATVSVNETASQSYHEYGDVEKLIVGEGHVYIDEGGSVGILDCTNAGSATVGKASTGKINSILVKDDSSAESILEDSVKTAITNGETEQVAETDVPEETELFAGGIGTEKSPFLIETAEQFLAIGQLNGKITQKPYYFRLEQDIDLQEVIADIPNGQLLTFFQGELDGNGKKLISPKDSYFIFAKYTVYDVSVYDLTIVQRGGEGMIVMFEQANNVTVGSGTKRALGTILFENIDVVGESANTLVEAGNNNSAFLCFARGDIRFINCTTSVNYNYTYGGLFLGGYAFLPDNKNEFIEGGDYARIRYINCVNTGIITGDCVGFFSGNTSQAKFMLVDSEEELDALATAGAEAWMSGGEVCLAAAYVENCSNANGTIGGTISAGAFAAGGGTVEKLDFNKQANDAISSPNANGTTRFTFGVIQKNSIGDMGLSLVEEESKKAIRVKQSADGAVAAYTLSYRVSTTIYDASGDGIGTSYVRIDISVPLGSQNTYKYITRAISSTEYETPFAEIAGGVYTDSYGHAYKLIAEADGSCIAVYDIQTVIKVAQNDFNGHTVNNVKIGSSVTYILTAFNNTNQSIGTIAYNGKLPVAE